LRLSLAFTGWLAGVIVFGALVYIRHTSRFLPAYVVVAAIMSIVVKLHSRKYSESVAPAEHLRDALIDAGILRIRPVLITVGATVLALFPLALHGGPLWEALCYAQIGGLAFATTVTLFIVPVLYSIFVLDLKIIRWEQLE